MQRAGHVAVGAKIRRRVVDGAAQGGHDTALNHRFEVNCVKARGRSVVVVCKTELVAAPARVARQVAVLRVVQQRDPA
jgi:hypothetical protein